MRGFNYRSFQDLAVCIRNGLYKLPTNLDLIVGIPRSGMIPAYMIGLMLNKSVCTMDEFIHGIEPSHGERSLNGETAASMKKRVLMVDDSIHSGVANQKAKDRLSGLDLDQYEILWLAVYAREESKDIPDFYFEVLPTPRAFEWNYLNSSIIARSCFDIDGVLCVDPTEEENDDGEKYRNFILHAKPLFIPTVKIHTIVTSRLEKYRKETETWLRNNGVQYEHLEMLNLPSKEDRIRLKAHASFKAQVYSSLPNTIAFYESDRKQAIEIAALTKKPCFCVGTDELFWGEEQSLQTIRQNMDKPVDIKGSRILLYTHELTYTGAPHSLLRICRIFLKNGCTAEVWSPIDGPFRKEFESLGVTVRVVENPALNSPKYLSMISEFDLAIANTVLSHRFYLAAIRLIPTVWYIREAMDIPDKVNGVPERRSALMCAPELYCVSEFAEEYINSHYNKNTRVLHNCVEDVYEAPHFSEDGVIRFGILGNVKYLKGTDIGVDAFDRLTDEQKTRARLLLGGRMSNGEDEYFEQVRTVIEKNSSITYLGEIIGAEAKKEFYENVDVIIVPSRTESCSLVALEAAMYGKPVITNRNVGAKYIVGKDSGWVIRPDDADELSAVIQEILEHPEKIKLMGENSRRHYLKAATISQYEREIVGMAAQVMRRTELIRKPDFQEFQGLLAIKDQETVALKKEIQLLTQSWTYKIGRFVTFVPRKVRGGIRCYQEHGMKYTLRRLREKTCRFFGRRV